jgi:predicted esterase
VKLLPLAALAHLFACAGLGDFAKDSADLDSADPNPESSPWEAPEYSGEACPTLEDGVNSGFDSAGNDRDLLIVLPEEPRGAPVLFAWHWLGGSASEIVGWVGYDDLAQEEGVIIVAPESDGNDYEWHSWDRPRNNPDLIFFDDLVSCLHAQFEVDLSRIYSTGMSAGGLWTSYLTTWRSNVLAATAPLSGGVNTAYYESPEMPIPVLLTWGGPSDTYAGYSFHTANLEFSESLRQDGHFVAECEHTGGHSIPQRAAKFTWEFLADHPKGLEREPYETGLPSGLPNYCRLPE